VTSRLLEILGSKYPIIQGPIGELNDPKMVAAVSEAGDFDVFPAGGGQISALIDEIKPVKDIIEGLVS
jgi:enoyl-[acyl-carrier protein] reductase II